MINFCSRNHSMMRSSDDVHFGDQRNTKFSLHRLLNLLRQRENLFTTSASMVHQHQRLVRVNTDASH